jgi:guanine deaminase
LTTSLRARVLSPTTGGGLRYLDDGLLVVDGGGRLASVGPFDAGAVAGAMVDLRPAIVVPGFVDTHVHYPQTRAVGSASGPLLDWLEETIFPEEARFADLAYAREVGREFTTRLLAAGTTTAAVYSSSSPGATAVCFEALDGAGLRAVVGLTLMDQACPEALRVPREVAIPAARELVARWHGKDGGRLRFAVTPRFAIACSRALMDAAAALAREHDLVVQTHVAENRREGEETLRLHPYGADYVDVYDRVGLLGPGTLLAHAIHLAPAEWERVAARDAAIAHCPDSNFFLGSGCMQLAEALRRGVRVGLGSDVAAGRTFEIRRAIASAYDASLLVGERVAPAELFRRATLGGAEALGVADVTGSIEPGKDADLAVVDAPAWLDGEDAALAHVAFASDLGRVVATYVRGVRRWPIAGPAPAPGPHPEAPAR